MRKIILASKSPRRKKLLQQINLSFDIKPSSADESFDSRLPPEDIVCQLANRKSTDVASQFGNALIIGADTIVAFRNTILEKPANFDEARRMLQTLSEQTHQVYTGVSLCKTNASKEITNTTTFAEKTDVLFGKLKSHHIENYVSSGSSLDKAGGYGIQDDFGAIFVKKIVGDYYNVVGFPLHSFYNKMCSFAPEYLPQINSSDA